MRQPYAGVRLPGGRKRGDRGWTVDIHPHRLGSGASGAATLSDCLQQAPLHAAATSGHLVIDAVGGLGLSLSGSALGGAPRTARGSGVENRTRFQNAVPLPRTCGRAHARPSGERNLTPVARRKAERSESGPPGGRCHRLGVGGSEHLLRPTCGSSWAKTAALEIRAEVGRGGRFRPEVRAGANGGAPETTARGCRRPC